MHDFKLFTLEEAERTLPLVRRVVADLTVEYPAWRGAVSRFELLTGGARADWGETQELVASREEVTRHADRINQYLQELEAIGCVFKGFGPAWWTSTRCGMTGPSFCAGGWARSGSSTGMRSTPASPAGSR